MRKIFEGCCNAYLASLRIATKQFIDAWRKTPPPIVSLLNDHNKQAKFDAHDMKLLVWSSGTRMTNLTTREQNIHALDLKLPGLILDQAMTY